MVAIALLADVFEQWGNVSQDIAAVLYEEAHKLTHLQRNKDMSVKSHHRLHVSIFFLYLRFILQLTAYVFIPL